MVIKTILLRRFTKTQTRGTEEGYSRGVQTGHRDFQGAFTLADEEQWQTRRAQETPGAVLHLELVIVFPRKVSVSFMNEPPDKTNRVKKRFAHTTHPTKCALLTQPAVHLSLKPWGSYKTTDTRLYAPHTRASLPGTHAGNGFTSSSPDKRKAISCLGKNCHATSSGRRKFSATATWGAGVRCTHRASPTPGSPLWPSRRNGLCDHTRAWPAETAQASQVEWVQPDHSNGLSNLAKSASKVKPALRVTSVKAKPWETWSQTLSQTLGKRPASHVTILRTFILQYGIGFLKLNNTSDNEIQGNRFFFFLSLKKFFLVWNL